MYDFRAGLCSCLNYPRDGQTIVPCSCEVPSCVVSRSLWAGDSNQEPSLWLDRNQSRLQAGSSFGEDRICLWVKRADSISGQLGWLRVEGSFPEPQQGLPGEGSAECCQSRLQSQGWEPGCNCPAKEHSQAQLSATRTECLGCILLVTALPLGPGGGKLEEEGSWD